MVGPHPDLFLVLLFPFHSVFIFYPVWSHSFEANYILALQSSQDLHMTVLICLLVGEGNLQNEAS